MNTTIGTYTAYASILVSILSYFGFIINQSEVVTVIAGIVTLISIIRQHFVTKKVVGMAKSLGAVNLK